MSLINDSQCGLAQRHAVGVQLPRKSKNQHPSLPLQQQAFAGSEGDSSAHPFFPLHRPNQQILRLSLQRGGIPHITGFPHYVGPLRTRLPGLPFESCRKTAVLQAVNEKICRLSRWIGLHFEIAICMEAVVTILFWSILYDYSTPI